jgi:LDH2 family malate/lactate/ureidoglycolate dehydrogenase
MPRLDASELIGVSERLLAAGGVPLEHARLVAKLLVKADLRGYPGHGVTRIGPYLAWIKEGTIQLADQAEILREGKRHDRHRRGERRRRQHRSLWGHAEGHWN